MKCVGAEDGSQPCQRCRRTGVEYVLIQRLRYNSSHPPAPGVFSRGTDAAENQAQSSFDFVYLLPVFFNCIYAGCQRLPKC